MKYCLQLNIYKHILQRHYGANVSAMFVVCLHPDLAMPWTYRVPSMDGEVEAMMSLRRRDLERKDVLGGADHVGADCFSAFVLKQKRCSVC